MDTAHGEMAEKQLDAIIERRSRNGEVDPDEQEELWKASVRAYTTRRREEMRAAWHEYHQGRGLPRGTGRGPGGRLSKKARRPLNRINLAVRLMRQGLSVGDATKRANVSEEQVRRALGMNTINRKGKHMTEHGRKLGAAGLSYGTPAAEEMISDRMRRLGEERHVAVGQLAASGDLKTMGDLTSQSVSLAEASEARGGVSAEERRGQTLYERAKAEAVERGVPLSTVMNEQAVRGEVKL